MSGCSFLSLESSNLNFDQTMDKFPIRTNSQLKHLVRSVQSICYNMFMFVFIFIFKPALWQDLNSKSCSTRRPAGKNWEVCMWDFLWAFSHPLLHKFHRDIYVYPREAQFEHNRCNYKCTWRAQPSAKANVTIFRDQDLHQNINGFSFAHASPLQQVSWNSACYVWDNRADRQRN